MSVLGLPLGIGCVCVGLLPSLGASVPLFHKGGMMALTTFAEFF